MLGFGDLEIVRDLGHLAEHDRGRAVFPGGAFHRLFGLFGLARSWRGAGPSEVFGGLWRQDLNVLLNHQHNRCQKKSPKGLSPKRDCGNCSRIFYTLTILRLGHRLPREDESGTLEKPGVLQA